MRKIGLILIAMLIALPAQAWFWDSKEEMPKASLPDLQGKPLNLAEDLRGKVLLVHFFAMDCHFCDKEILLLLEPLYQKYKAKGFVPIAVNVGEIEKGDVRWKKFASLTYPLLVDEKGVVAKRFGVIALPTSFVVDGEGVVQKKLTGEGKIEDYEKLFTTVLP